ncbi:glycosyl hydrolase family 3 N terminal domain-containing protein [Pseudomassariella vexata]|uniref:beta-glucosidase n=1 Tax=Pseudomassariella vexata TaxID=1141098 RepID=A0A1Y2DAZ8_9PEZI|nr:glycosyl hydrolase family 3 N terminal domain-containing protein [Pseudomassariella vexata]ORY56324.1 glycosyl hydrolase family 3 N terminal domain-containing protein [Pseudomassariella vexata]
MANINVEETLKKLSMAEKVDLLAGIDFWHTKALPQHGIPSLRLSDGPNGVRGTKFFNGIKAACFPCGTALGATFNVELLEEAGKKMGEEAKVKGAHVILGPTINMQRSPLGGRGFESLGEDPILAGLGAAAIVRGIQSTGVQATIKHFVCNDHEHKRNAVQAMITERALREIYALPFQLTVRDANPGSFMTGYNGVNGTYCSENKELLEKILRGEWGWDGMVMSDWFGVYSTTEAALAGLDLEMPGPTRFRGDQLKFNVSTDKVRTHILDQRVKAMLEFIKKCSASGVKDNAPEGTADTPETAELLRRIGNEGIVLMKNEKNVLPLKKDRKTVVIGPNAKIATYHGGGSASLAAYYAVTPFTGISNKLSIAPKYTIGQYSHKLLPLLGYTSKSAKGNQGMTMKVYTDGPDVSDRKVVDELELLKTEMLLVDYTNPKLKSNLWYATFEGSLVAEEDCTYEFGLVVSGTANLYVNDELVVDNTEKQTLGDAFFGSATIEEKGYYKMEKGKTYNFKVNFGSAPTSKLSGNTVLQSGGALRIGGCKVIDPKAEIAHAAELAKSADQVIICAGLNADWETEGNDRANMDLPPGMDDLISAVAKANPNTAIVLQSGTPVAMPWINDVNALIHAWYGGNETGNTIADVLFGDANPSGKLPLSFPVRVQDNPAFLNYRTEGGRVIYGEDIYIGYRYYEFAEREVLFPFGHGLSYTTFAFSDLSVTAKEGKLTVSLTVKNTGGVKGSEVAQVYVQPKQKAKVNRPVKEMKGFAKVELAPGESKTVKVEMETKYAANYWDEERNQWCVEDGEYEVIVSDSSKVEEGKAVKGNFVVKETYWWSGI